MISTMGIVKASVEKNSTQFLMKSFRFITSGKPDQNLDHKIDFFNDFVQFRSCRVITLFEHDHYCSGESLVLV